MSFKSEFAVSMHCEDCVSSIKSLLSRQPNLDRYSIDLASKSVTVEGRAAPSKIAQLLKNSGREVIVRGTGSASGEHAGAGVCIFESLRSAATQQIHGIARLIQVQSTTILDLSVSQHASTSTAQNYAVYIAKTGNISDGAASTGEVFKLLGELNIANNGNGEMFKDVEGLNVADVIGRAMVIAPKGDDGKPDNTKALMSGVIARSAGAWTNDKTVCSCTGKTMWEENRLSANL